MCLFPRMITSSAYLWNILMFLFLCVLKISVRTLPASSQNIQPAGKITEQSMKSKNELRIFTVNTLLHIGVKKYLLFSFIECDFLKTDNATYSDNLKFWFYLFGEKLFEFASQLEFPSEQIFHRTDPWSAP